MPRNSPNKHVWKMPFFQLCPAFDTGSNLEIKSCNLLILLIMLNDSDIKTCHNS